MNVLNSVLVEVNFSATPGQGTKQAFPDLPILRTRGSKIYAVECISATQLSQSPNNKSMISQSNAALLTLTLMERGNSEEFVKEFPCTSLIKALNDGRMVGIGRWNNGNPIGVDVDFSKSTVNVVNTGISANYSICFNIFYITTK